MQTIPQGVVEHYKHHLYRVFGAGRTAVGPPTSNMTSLGAAHYSEDPTLTLQVYFVSIETWDYHFVVTGLPDDYQRMLVIYAALYGDNAVPRLAVRPLDGESGFVTPVFIRGHEQPRFRPVPDDFGVQYPTIADRHQPDGSIGHFDGVDRELCGRCGLPIS